MPKDPFGTEVPLPPALPMPSKGAKPAASTKAGKKSKRWSAEEVAQVRGVIREVLSGLHRIVPEGGKVPKKAHLIVQATKEMLVKTVCARLGTEPERFERKVSLRDRHAHMVAPFFWFLPCADSRPRAAALSRSRAVSTRILSRPSATPGVARSNAEEKG
jgi:hypothetical protein